MTAPTSRLGPGGYSVPEYGPFVKTVYIPPLTVYVGYAARLLVGDRSGRLLAELPVDLGMVSWRLNEVGVLTFEMSREDDLATEINLAYGNRVYLEFDNGLPAWGGVIDLPRKWDSGVISTTVYSAEHLMKWRITDSNKVFTGATIADIFQGVLNDANTRRPTGVVVGDVWSDGGAHNVEYHYTNLFNVLHGDICERLSSAEWAVIPSLQNGRIVFTANLYERRGYAKPNVALIEGHNISSESLTEQGPVINSWYVAGAGQTWGASRLTASAGAGYDEESDAVYGLRESGYVAGDISDQATLDAVAGNKVAGSAARRNIPVLTASNLPPAEFADYGVGDTVRVLLHTAGFDGYDASARVTTREFDPATNTCKLVVEEGA